MTGTLNTNVSREQYKKKRGNATNRKKKIIAYSTRVWSFQFWQNRYILVFLMFKKLVTQNCKLKNWLVEKKKLPSTFEPFKREAERVSLFLVKKGGFLESVQLTVSKVLKNVIEEISKFYHPTLQGTVM